MLKSLLQKRFAKIPWPSIIDGIDLLDGDSLHANVICEQKCTNRICRNFEPSSVEHTCPLGLTYYQKSIDGIEVITYGVIAKPTSANSGNRYLKNANKNRRVTLEQFSDWIAYLTNLNQELKVLESQLFSKVLHPLHDTMRLTGEVVGLATKLVNSDSRKTFEENFQSATTETKTLLKATQLLSETFDAVSIYYNPNAARYGRIRPTQLYQLLDKLQLIMNIADSGHRHVRVNFTGNGFNTYRLYDSFKYLPFTLLHNAIKYCQHGDVTLNIAEDDYGAKVTVISTGPKIESDELEEIFKPEQRGKWAKELNIAGSGVGLYIAKIVASAHNTSIHVESRDLAYSDKKIPQAENIFWFVVRSMP